MARKEKETVHTKSKNKILSTQRYLDFAGVHDDTLILKNGGLRAILEVSSVNFNLKSEEEQNAIIYGYQRFVNALNFPVQILVKSRKLDIDQYLDSLKEKLRHQQNELLKAQMSEYIEYVAKLVEYADIMEKKFYVVVPQNPLRAEQKGTLVSFWQKIHPDDKVEEIIKRRKEFKMLKRGLDERINIVTTGLENCGLNVTQLGTERIIQLFYQCYNPQLSRQEKVVKYQDYGLDDQPEDKLITED